MIPVDVVNSAGLPSPHTITLGLLPVLKTVYDICSQLINQLNQFIRSRKTQMVTNTAIVERDA